MAKTAQQIYDEIVAYINSEGGAYNTWYVGITSDIEGCLFGDHHVSKIGHSFIWFPAASASAARNIEDALLKLGLDGIAGGGDDTCNNVYCYKKMKFTDP